MHLSISNSISFLALSLLAFQPSITNGAPVRDLMSRGQNRINSTHIPFPVFLRPVSVTVAFSEAVNESRATAIPTTPATATAVTTDVTSHIINRRNDAEAETKKQTYDQPLQEQRRDFISTITKQLWDSIGEMMGSYGAKPTGVHDVVNIADERAKNGTNGSIKDRRMYGEGCLWGEWKDC